MPQSNASGSDIRASGGFPTSGAGLISVNYYSLGSVTFLMSQCAGVSVRLA